MRTGTVAVVTGAGSGIGLAVARTLGARGCRLALIDVRGDRLESARAALAAVAPAVSVHVADVGDEEGIVRAAAEARRAHGPAALLVNSAGVSLAGYCASKFAVRGFSEALRAELRPEGNGVTVVYPGPVDTNLLRDGRATDDRAAQEEAAFLARRGLPADQVARQVVRAVERDAARVVVGLDYRAIDLLVRLAPSRALALIGRFGRRFMAAGGSPEPSAAGTSPPRTPTS